MGAATRYRLRRAHRLGPPKPTRGLTITPVGCLGGRVEVLTVTIPQPRPAAYSDGDGSTFAASHRSLLARSGGRLDGAGLGGELPRSRPPQRALGRADRWRGGIQATDRPTGASAVGRHLLAGPAVRLTNEDAPQTGHGVPRRIATGTDRQPACSISFPPPVSASGVGGEWTRPHFTRPSSRMRRPGEPNL